MKNHHGGGNENQSNIKERIENILIILLFYIPGILVLLFCASQKPIPQNELVKISGNFDHYQRGVTRFSVNKIFLTDGSFYILDGNKMPFFDYDGFIKNVSFGQEITMLVDERAKNAFAAATIESQNVFYLSLDQYYKAESSNIDMGIILGIILILLNLAIQIFVYCRNRAARKTGEQQAYQDNSCPCRFGIKKGVYVGTGILTMMFPLVFGLIAVLQGLAYTFKVFEIVSIVCSCLMLVIFAFLWQHYVFVDDEKMILHNLFSKKSVMRDQIRFAKYATVQRNRSDAEFFEIYTTSHVHPALKMRCDLFSRSECKKLSEILKIENYH
jgi:hypothetical protein